MVTGGVTGEPVGGSPVVNTGPTRRPNGRTPMSDEPAVSTPTTTTADETAALPHTPEPTSGEPVPAEHASPASETPSAEPAPVEPTPPASEPVPSVEEHPPLRAEHGPEGHEDRPKEHALAAAVHEPADEPAPEPTEDDSALALAESETLVPVPEPVSEELVPVHEPVAESTAEPSPEALVEQVEESASTGTPDVTEKIDEPTPPKTAKKPRTSRSPKAKVDSSAAPPAEEPPPSEDLEPSPAPADATSENKKKWYAIKVQSGREDSIKAAILRKVRIEGLEEYFGRIEIPVEEVTEKKSVKVKDKKTGETTFQEKKVTRKKKKFQGYLFAELEFNDRILYLFRETSGVGDFLNLRQKPGQPPTPEPMPEHEVQSMLTGIAVKDPNKKLKQKIDLEKGDKVRIREGSFASHEGEVKSIVEAKDANEAAKVIVVLTFWGRPLDVELESTQVEKV
jgi:transcription termination/antitermination protein NusG